MQKSRCRYQKRDPELARCRTSRIGAVMPGSKMEMFYCSIEDADCRYALSVGFDYVCKHNDNYAFATAEDS